MLLPQGDENCILRMIVLGLIDIPTGRELNYITWAEASKLGETHQMEWRMGCLKI